MSEGSPAPLSRRARGLGLAWALAVVALYLLVRETGLALVP